MDFVVSLPRTVGQYDLIWVIVDRYNKFAHFLHVRTTYNVEQYEELYVKNIERLDSVLKSIISDKDLMFTSKFWGSLKMAMCT